MSDPNMITAYSWAAGLLFQQELPSSLADVEKRARLVNEINTPLIQGKDTSVPAGAMLMDLDDNERYRRLDDISQVGMSYLTEQLDNMVTKNILLRLWAGCIDAAKAIRFNYVVGVRDGQVIEAPITIEYRQILFKLIDLLAKTDSIYRAGVEAAPVYKKILKEYYANNNAPITLVEYGDYECPYTGMAYPIVKELIREFGNDKIRFVFCNFPLNDIHPHAQHASEAAEAAAAIDGFSDLASVNTT